MSVCVLHTLAKANASRKAEALSIREPRAREKATGPARWLKEEIEGEDKLEDVTGHIHLDSKWPEIAL